AVSDYAAIIDWGDGTTSLGSVTFAGALGSTTDKFTVSGAHTYKEESAAEHAGSNPYAVKVTISHEAAPSAVVSTTAAVSDPAVLATAGAAISAVEGQLSASQAVATFTDPGGAEAVGDYGATIDWGDGSTS